MNKVVAVLVAGFMIAPAMAGTVCREDAFGNIQCRDTYSGDTTTIREDSFGNTTIRDNRTGTTTRCRTDAFGNIRCN